ncbi:hypothetical protein [Amycolatopsis minnesotensis]|uniref:TRAP-type mannitol/chloroaromatic compound transport system, small permease component n=1 Tax=Amycolatopsis minnesotensis TaxID=337894 RepID=A0ABN2SBU8_9PSEU
MACDHSATVTEPPPRLTLPRLRTQFNAIRNTVFALWALALGTAFTTIVLWHPQQLLGPAASGGTPQHVLTAVAVGVVLWKLGIYGGETIHGDLGATHHVNSLSDTDLARLYTAGAWLHRKTVAAATALAALGLWPLLPAVRQAWIGNDPAVTPGLATTIGIRLLPVFALMVLMVLLRWILFGTMCGLELRQQRIRDDAEDTAAEVTDAAASPVPMADIRA